MRNFLPVPDRDAARAEQGKGRRTDDIGINLPHTALHHQCGRTFTHDLIGYGCATK